MSQPVKVYASRMPIYRADDGDKLVPVYYGDKKPSVKEKQKPVVKQKPVARFRVGQLVRLTPEKHGKGSKQLWKVDNIGFNEINGFQTPYYNVLPVDSRGKPLSMMTASFYEAQLKVAGQESSGCCVIL